MDRQHVMRRKARVAAEGMESDGLRLNVLQTEFDNVLRASVSTAFPMAVLVTIGQKLRREHHWTVIQPARDELADRLVMSVKAGETPLEPFVLYLRPCRREGQLPIHVPGNIVRQLLPSSGSAQREVITRCFLLGLVHDQVPSCQAVQLTSNHLRTREVRFGQLRALEVCTN